MTEERTLAMDLIDGGLKDRFYYSSDAFAKRKPGQWITPYKVRNISVDENGRIIAGLILYNFDRTARFSTEDKLANLLNDIRATSDPFNLD